MTDYIKVAAYTALATLALVALVVGMTAGEPMDKIRFWLALALLGLFVVAFIAGLVGRWVERVSYDEYEAAQLARHRRELEAVQQQAAEQFLAGFEHANNLHASAVDSVAKSWGVAAKAIPRTSMPPMGLPMAGRMAELAEGNGHSTLEL